MLRARRRTWFASGLTGVLAAGTIFGLVMGSGVVLGAAPAANAVDSSAVTVTAKEQDLDFENAPFPDLSVTVSQTQNLRQQGLAVSWTGATGHSAVPATASNGGSWFLQVFQCWGDDPENKDRPDRTTCQYGGVDRYGATRDATRRYEYDSIPAQDQPYSAPRASSFEGAYTSIPFRPRNGASVSSITTNAAGTKVRDTTVNVNNNAHFNVNSTNEVPWAGSGADGTGDISFEVQTTMQSPGLGCGDPVEVAGAIAGASCWLVILPRSAADNGSATINQSGLFWDSWQHAISVRIGFEPVGSRCAIGAAERQLAGSEIASLAVQSWQPVLCQQEGGSVYSHLMSAESDALAAAARTQDAPLALTSLPAADGATGLTYAPVALSGLVISFAVDRNPDPFKVVPPEYAAGVNLPFAEMRLTPRLVAKLLTNSYWGSLPPELDHSYLGAKNPENITRDPDFLAVNSPEWGYQTLNSPALADVLMPQGRSDAARAVWEYIMSDPEAAAFMAGEPDPHGMTVNPWYATTAEKNASGTAFEAPRDNFPKADPAEVVPPQQNAINVVAWRPYVNDLDSAAYLTLRGDGQVLGPWDPNSAPAKYGKPSRSLRGSQKVLGVSDAAASSRYEVKVAALRNPAGEYVLPGDSSLLAAAAAMQTTGSDGVVRQFDNASAAAKGATSAYPLTVPVYAAANPALLSAELRADYAAFIRYAATRGQASGTALGQLPAGYATLPQGWVDQALAAADVVEKGATSQPSIPAPQPAPLSSAPSAGTAVPVVAAPVAQAPAATGATAGPLSGGKTPDDPDAGALAVAVPASVLAGLAGAAGVPLITRFRRRVA